MTKSRIVRQHAALRLALMLSAGSSISCGDKWVAEVGRPTMAMSLTQTRLSVGDTLRLRATADGRPCNDCVWDSRESAHASVDATGLVRALAPGWAVVTATYRYQPGAKTSALIEVVAP